MSVPHRRITVFVQTGRRARLLTYEGNFSMDNCAESATLYFKSGSSDKVYRAQIDAADGGGYVVNVAYGRRGGTLALIHRSNRSWGGL